MWIVDLGNSTARATVNSHVGAKSRWMTILMVPLALISCAAPTSTKTPRTAESSQTEKPHILSLSCDARFIELDDVLVAASPEGVHVRVRNEAQSPVYFQFAPEADGPWGGAEVPPGTADLGVQLPPGTATVRCSDGDGTATDEVPIEIVEAEARFVPYYLECSGEAMTLTASVAPWASRHEALSDPVSAARHAATGIRPSHSRSTYGRKAAPTRPPMTPATSSVHPTQACRESRL